MRELYLLIGVIVISTIALGQSTIQVDQTGNINLSTTTPSSPGTQPPSPLAVQPVTGSASSSAPGQGSSPSIAAGTGGAGTGSSTIGGTGGSLTFTSGNGGNSGSTAANSNGGNVLINLGGPSTTGVSNTGLSGTVLLSAQTGFPISAGGLIASPLLCGPASTGICLYWIYDNSSMIYKVLAWRDCTTGGCPNTGNQVSAGLDDQGIRLIPTGAIRFTSGALSGTLTFNNGCLTTEGMGTGTLSIGGAGSGNDPCNADDHGGNLTLTKATVRRVSDDNGTALVTGDFVLSASWGSGATKTVNRGVDGAFSFTVTEGGTGQMPNPTVTLTFTDGTWGNTPVSTCDLDGSTTDNFVPLAVKDTATTLIVTYIGTAVATKAVTFQCQTTGT